MRIDSHQHFWNYSPAEYPWMQEAWPIRRDFLPQDLEPMLRECEITGTIAVQARQTLEETRWLLELADRHPSIQGVVGWVDLRSAELPDQLERFAAHPKLVGVRHVVQDEPDDAFMLGTDFLRGIEQLQRFGLTYDVLVFPRQIPAAIELAKRFPEQLFVLDHMAKPDVRAGSLHPWKELVLELGSSPNVACKVSGIITEADWGAWCYEDFEPYFEVIVKAFGPGRLLYGSDWPVCVLAGNYQRVYQLAERFTRDWPAADREAFFGDNAARLYGLA